MASINGIEINPITEFIDHEGFLIYQGTVYYNGEELGHWSQNYNGAPYDDFAFDYHILDEEIARFVNSDYSDGDPFCAEGLLMAEIVSLNEVEKFFEEAIAEGYNIVVASHGVKVDMYATVLDDEDDITQTQDYIDFASRNDKVFVYRSLDDFNVVL